MLYSWQAISHSLPSWILTLQIIMLRVSLAEIDGTSFNVQFLNCPFKASVKGILQNSCVDRLPLLLVSEGLLAQTTPLQGFLRSAGPLAQLSLAGRHSFTESFTYLALDVRPSYGWCDN